MFFPYFHCFSLTFIVLSFISLFSVCCVFFHSSRDIFIVSCRIAVVVFSVGSEW